VQSQQLLTKSQVFEDQVLAGVESADYPPEEMPERQDHGKNFIGKVRIELCAKSFILWMYDVLARHSPSFELQRDFNPPEQRVAQRALPDCRPSVRSFGRHLPDS
jgi:hypothetical protein